MNSVETFVLWYFCNNPVEAISINLNQIGHNCKTCEYLFTVQSSLRTPWFLKICHLIISWSRIIVVRKAKAVLVISENLKNVQKSPKSGEISNPRPSMDLTPKILKFFLVFPCLYLTWFQGSAIWNTQFMKKWNTLMLISGGP